MQETLVWFQGWGLNGLLQEGIKDKLPTPVFLGFPSGSDGKEYACNVGDLGLIPGLGAHICMKCPLGISNFLEEISSLSHSIVFLYFFALMTEKAFLSLLAILWNSVIKWIYLSFSPLPLTSLLFSAICKASSDNHFAFLHFFFLGMVLITVSCTMS